MTFTDLTLARRLEATHAWRSIRYAQAWAKLHPQQTPAVVQEVGGGWVVLSGPGSPVHSACGLGLHGPLGEDDLNWIERLFRRAGEPPRIDLCPLAEPSFVQLLARRGYVVEEFRSMLTYDLTKHAGCLPVPDGVEVCQAGPELAELWIQTTAQGFSEQDVPPQQMLEVLAPNFYAHDGIPFLAWWDGQPAGGGGTYVHDGAIELGGDSTRPPFRRHGVETALLLARLSAAREMGCDLAMATTTPGSASQRNTERLGFQLAYTKAILFAPSMHGQHAGTESTAK